MADLGTTDTGITKVLVDAPLRPNLGLRMGFSSRVLTQHAQALGSILRTKVEKTKQNKNPNPIQVWDSSLTLLENKTSTN